MPKPPVWESSLESAPRISQSLLRTCCWLHWVLQDTTRKGDPGGQWRGRGSGEVQVAGQVYVRSWQRWNESKGRYGPPGNYGDLLHVSSQRVVSSEPESKPLDPISTKGKNHQLWNLPLHPGLDLLAPRRDMHLFLSPAILRSSINICWQPTAPENVLGLDTLLPKQE